MREKLHSQSFTYQFISNVPKSQFSHVNLLKRFVIPHLFYLSIHPPFSPSSLMQHQPGSRGAWSSRVGGAHPLRADPGPATAPQEIPPEIPLMHRENKKLYHKG